MATCLRGYKEVKMKFSDVREFLEEIKKVILESIESTKSHYADMEDNYEKVVYSILYMAMYIVIFVCILIMIVYVFILFLLFVICKIRDKINSQKKFVEPYIKQYTEYIVADILYDVLQDSASVLGVTTPKQLKDIIPTRMSVVQRKNGFTYYHFIVYHPNNPNQDFLMMRDLITIKMEQILQTLKQLV